MLRWLRRPLIDAVPWTRRLRHYGIFLLLIGLSSPISHAYLDIELSPRETLVHSALVVAAVAVVIVLVEAFMATALRHGGRDSFVSTGGFVLRSTIAYALSVPAVGFAHAPFRFTRSILDKHATATEGWTSWELLPIVSLIVYVAYQIIRKDYLARELATIRHINDELQSSRPERRRAIDEPDPTPSLIHVQSKGLDVPLNVESVVRVQSDQNYCHVIADAGPDATSRRYLVRMTLNEARARLPERLFLQTHRSHIVNVRFVAALHRDGRRRELRLSNGERVPVSRSRAQSVKARISDFLAGLESTAT